MLFKIALMITIKMHDVCDLGKVVLCIYKVKIYCLFNSFIFCLLHRFTLHLEKKLTVFFFNFYFFSSYYHYYFIIYYYYYSWMVITTLDKTEIKTRHCHDHSREFIVYCLLINHSWWWWWSIIDRSINGIYIDRVL